MNAQARQLCDRCWQQQHPSGRWHRASLIALFLSVLMLGAGPGFDRVSIADAAIAGWCDTSLRPADVWNTLTVDMNVKRQRLTASGDPLGAPSPETTYRLERSSRTGGWKTIFTVLAVARPPIYSFNGALTSPAPFPVTRIEDDENGSPVRAYGADGVLLTPTLLNNTNRTTTTPRTSGQQWLDAFVAAPSKRAARQQAFERAYGKASKAGALSRYVHIETDGSEEVMVDATAMVPVEATTMRGGKRLGHRTFVYGPAPDSALVRTRVHADTPTTADASGRVVVDTTFSHVCLELRR